MDLGPLSPTLKYFVGVENKAHKNGYDEMTFIAQSYQVDTKARTLVFTLIGGSTLRVFNMDKVVCFEIEEIKT